MKRIEVLPSTGNCQIIINESLKNLKDYVKNEKAVVITDKNVHRLYKNRFPDFEVIEIGQGENIKTLNTLKKIYQNFLNLEIDRSSFVIGIGGGIVCDITGFAASTFMRGIRFAFAPSTLLAQVDAGIGGKNGINFRGYKNIIGVFKQPQFSLLDFELLKSLPKKEILCGLAEIVKRALIESPSLFTYFEKNWEKLLSLQTKAVRKAVVDSLKIKSRIVQADTTEKGARRKLNFGHTFGHALEKVNGLPHGEAVSLGMMIAVQIAVSKDMLSVKDARRIGRLLRNLKLPTRFPLNKDLLLEAIKKDKKRQGKDIHFVFLTKIGKAVVKKISLEKMEEYLHDLCKSC